MRGEEGCWSANYETVCGGRWFRRSFTSRRRNEKEKGKDEERIGSVMHKPPSVGH